MVVTPKARNINREISEISEKNKTYLQICNCVWFFSLISLISL